MSSQPNLTCIWTRRGKAVSHRCKLLETGRKQAKRELFSIESGHDILYDDDSEGLLW